MSHANPQLEHLLLCIGSRCDLEQRLAEDRRFLLRFQQAVRACLGSTTREAEAFTESLFGGCPAEPPREHTPRLRLVTGPATPAH